MVMLRNIMEGRYSFTSPEWDDISGKHDIFIEPRWQKNHARWYIPPRSEENH